MASVQKRAAGYIAKTKSARAVGYTAAKQPARSGSPNGTVKDLNQGVLKGPTTRGS